VSSAIDKVVKRGQFWHAYLHQTEFWIPKDRPPVKIVEMHGQWRKNAAAFMLRRVHVIEPYYSAAELYMMSQPVPYVTGERADGTLVEHTDPTITHLPTEGSMAADVYDQELHHRSEHPEEWLKSTPLYKALLEGIESDGDVQT